MAGAIVNYPSGDGVVRGIIESMIQKEYQFGIVWRNENKVLISFNRGVWTIFDTKTSYVIEVNDDPAVVQCYSPLVRGYLESRIKIRLEDEPTLFDRVVPSKAICDYLKIQYGEIDDLEVTVYKAGRNGFIDSDGKLYV